MRLTETPIRAPRLGGCLLLSALLAAPLAWGQAAPADSRDTTMGSGSASAATPRPPAAGERTERLLDLQRSGRLASPRQQTLSGEVQSRTYRRYVESFSHPIPDNYIDLDFGE